MDLAISLPGQSQPEPPADQGAAASWNRPLLALAAICVAYTATQIYRSQRVPSASDYSAFAIGSRLLGRPGVCLYSAGDQAHALLGFGEGGGVNFVNPPLAAWIVSPIASLAPGPGLAVFQAATLAAVAVGMLLLGRGLLPQVWSSGTRVRIALITTLTVPAAATFTFGQWDGLCFLAASAGLVLLSRRRDLVAGLCVSLLLVKPQLVWMAPLFGVLAGRWRFLLGLAMGGAGFAVSALLLVNPGCLATWPDRLVAEADQIASTVGLPGLVAHLSGSTRLGAGSSGVLVVLAMGLGVRYRNRLRADPVAGLALAMAASVLFGPHAFTFDLLLVSPALLLLAGRRLRLAILLTVCLDVSGLLELIIGRNLLENVSAVAVMVALATTLAGPNPSRIADAASEPRRSAGLPG